MSFAELRVICVLKEVIRCLSEVDSCRPREKGKSARQGRHLFGVLSCNWGTRILAATRTASPLGISTESFRRKGGKSIPFTLVVYQEL